MNQLIFHVDINSCYASCEKILDPSIRDKPVVVLSNNDGCIIALDNKAKALGFSMGTPWFQVEQRVKELGVVARSSNYELYGNISSRVMLLLNEYAENFEQYSIDEAFLTITATPLQALKIASTIKKDLAQRVGVPVCIGVAKSKTLAKLANKTAKKIPALQGVCVWEALPQDRRTALLTALPVSEVWGVGKATTKKLAGMGITSIQDLKDAPVGIIRKRFSVVLMRTVLELNGIKALEREAVREFKDQLIYSRSFSEPITGATQMREVLSVYAQRASTRLTRHQQVAGVLSAFCASSYYAKEGYVSGASQVRLPGYTADPVVLTRASMSLLEKAAFDGAQYVRAGIIVTDLKPAGAMVALDIFQYQHESRDVALLLQSVHEKYGVNSLGLGHAGLARPAHWEMKREMLSPRGTTHWNELVTAKL